MFKNRNPYTLPSLGAAWKAAFQEDLQELPYNIVTFIGIKGIITPARDTIILKVMLDAFERIRQGYHPIDVLDFIYNSLQNSQFSGIQPLHALDIISNDLIFHDITSSTYSWAKIEQYEKLTVAQQNDLTNLVITSLNPIVVIPPSENQNIHNLIYRFILLGDNINEVVSKANDLKKNPDKLSQKQLNAKYATLYKSYIKNFNDLMNLSLDISGEITRAQTLTMQSTRRPAADTLQANKDGQIIKNNLTKYLGVCNDLITAYFYGQSGDYGNTIISSISAIQSVTTLPPNLVQVTSFLTDIATADSAAQIKQALSSAILPVGSYRQKREPNTNSLFIQAYVGGTYGMERLYYNNTYVSTETQGGVFMPIGVEWDCYGNNIVTPGIFISAVDLGAAASYQFSTSNVTSSKLNLTELVSPGAYLVIGIATIPLTVGYGFSYNSNVSIDQSNQHALNALKYGGFLAVDIPLFRLAHGKW